MRIAIERLAKAYGPVAAARDLSFEAAPGRVCGFLGPNGSGKTTTLRCLFGLVRPDAGSATFDGRRYVELRDPMRHVGALLDPDAHHPDRSGREHLRVLCDASELPLSRADETLRLVELEPAADRRAGGYSLGMRQRLHLAAALLGDPAALVLDEPANGLDPQGIRWLRDRLRALAAEGRTVLLSSHVLGEVRQTVDDVVVIAGGRLAAAGTLQDVLAVGGTRLRVRSPEPGAVRALVERLGGVASDANGALDVRGVEAEALARAALQARVLLTLLEEREPDLERRYFELTGERS
jgi:ABC-2 type transport system ATP-binding protein